MKEDSLEERKRHRCIVRTNELLKINSKAPFNNQESLSNSQESDDKPVPFESFEAGPGAFLRIVDKKKQEKSSLDESQTVFDILNKKQTVL
jgi:hypothetical protein